MGIEDLNLDLEELADNVLLVTPNTETKNTVAKLLELRSYRWKHVETFTEAINVSSEELFDLIIYERMDDKESMAQLVDNVTLEPGMRQASLLILAQLEEDEESSGGKVFTGETVKVADIPFEASDLMVKIVTLLRLRKTKTTQAHFERELLSQNAQLRDLTNRFKRELKEAQDVQKALMPEVLPTHPQCLFASTYIPFEAVGGDLFDIWQIEEGLYGMFIGDVTGHGLPAAFIGSMTKMALAYAKNLKSPDETLAQMNNDTADYMPEERFVTAAAAVFEPGTGKFTMARGGHPPPVIWRAKSKEVEEATPDGMPVGVLKDMVFDLFETTLEPGDKVLMVTDGVTEAANMQGALLGIAGLSKFFAESCEKLEINNCLERVYELVRDFTGGRIIKDDVTLLGLEQKGAEDKSS